jgi:hypothetical protein
LTFAVKLAAMKTTNLVISLFVSSLIATACTPRDPKLSKDLGASNKQGGNNGASATEFSMGNFSIAAFIGERHIEAIELLKVATGSLDDKQTSYVRTDGAINDVGAQTRHLKSSDEDVTYVNYDDEWNVNYNKNIDVAFTKDITVKSADIKGTNLFAKVDSANKNKTYVNLNDKTYTMKVTATQDPNVLQVEVNATGILSGAKGGKNTNKEISMTINMKVAADSLETSEVMILSADSILYYPSTNPKAKPGEKYTMPFKATNLKVNLKAACNALEGKASATAGKSSFVATFNKEAVSIDGKNWKNNLAECGKRPTLDLPRLHVF